MRLLNGDTPLTINPEMRGTAEWSVEEYIRLIQRGLNAEMNDDQRNAFRTRLTDLINRLDEEVRNTGLTPEDRALNFAATQLLTLLSTVAADLLRVDDKGKFGFELDDVSPPQPSKICRDRSDCWDVEFSFLNPENVVEARTIIRQTVDVVDVVPVFLEDPRRYKKR